MRGVQWNKWIIALKCKYLQFLHYSCPNRSWWLEQLTHHSEMDIKTDPKGCRFPCIIVINLLQNNLFVWKGYSFTVMSLRTVFVTILFSLMTWKDLFSCHSVSNLNSNSMIKGASISTESLCFHQLCTIPMQNKNKLLWSRKSLTSLSHFLLSYKETSISE